MKRRRLIIACLSLAALVVVAGWWLSGRIHDRIPAFLEAALPEDCLQVMLVLSPAESATSARLTLLEREPGGAWWRTAGPVHATLGHKGLAWGTGDFSPDTRPAGFREKREGDGCSPAGVFRIPFAFGTGPAESAEWLRLRYVPLTPTIIGVDDPKSRHYNQVVDSTAVERDWDSNEAMMRHDRLYEWGAFIAHNPQCVPGGGSCIFLHLWPGEGRATAGCTAMSAENLRRVLSWLDATKNPRLVQGLETW